MFSYLRPHHKRTSSNPSSPADPSHPSFESNLHSDHGHPQRQNDTGFPEPPTRPPPLLPPIARVAPADSNIENLRGKGFERDVRIQNAEALRSNGTRPPDIQTYTSRQRPQYGTKKPRELPGIVGSTNSGSRPSTGSNQDMNSKQMFSNSTSNLVTNTDPQNKIGFTGRKPNGARLPSPPPASTSTYSTFEPAPARSSKTRLNLLNPMSLLARRRTSQAITQLSPESLVSSRNRNDFSETFDPRIRGTVVHDFSAPRPPRRNVSYSDVQAEKNKANTSRQFENPNGDQSIDENLAGPWSGGNHTPVFTENFEEEQYPAAGPHVRKASDLTDLPLPKPPYAKGAQKSTIESSLTPKSNEAAQRQFQASRDISQAVPDQPPPVPPKPDAPLPEARRVSIDPASTTPKAGSKKGRSRNGSEVSAKDAAIPKHMKSTSSRFSFDMIGAAEQERLLEDRHRQKALEKKTENGGVDEREDEFEDDYDYDNMDDDDGLEERIPGVNADLDEEEDAYEFSHEGGNLGGFTFQQSLLSPMSPASPGMVSTPRDANGEVIGFAMSKNSPYLALGIAQDPITSPTLAPSPDFKDADHFPVIQGLRLQGIGIQSGIGLEEQPAPPEPEIEDFPRPTTLDDDDLYFDDGVIAGPGDEDNVEFDESVFDNIDTDKYGRPLRPFQAPLSTLYSPPVLKPDSSPYLGKIAEQVQDEKDPSDHVSQGSITEKTDLLPHSSILESTSVVAPATQGLTQDTLAAYQSALAAAAFTAAANGKFRRDSTPPNPDPSDQDDNQPGLVTDSSQASHYDAFSPSYEMEDDFDYDDVLEDDPIIAAANAEALANDCDGFYGQEFGFYSAPAAAEAEYANGGYFGPRGVEGINRSQSGRVASREPNLTPITERSEYSNRNSFMSLNMLGIGSTPSPGLAQLAGMMRGPDYDGDMSLDALLKLRRGAWGGSQASLHSSNGGTPKSALEDSSPIGQNAPWNQSSVLGPSGNNGPGHRRKNSALSLASEGTGAQSEVGSLPGSPTITRSLSALDTSNPDENSKAKDDKDKDAKFRKHRYNSSAESISYSKEDDPVAGERWILERRRTSEGGEIELLGREVVSGGRI